MFRVTRIKDICEHWNNCMNLRVSLHGPLGFCLYFILLPVAVIHTALKSRKSEKRKDEGGQRERLTHVALSQAVERLPCAVRSRFNFSKL